MRTTTRSPLASGQRATSYIKVRHLVLSIVAPYSPQDPRNTHDGHEDDDPLNSGERPEGMEDALWIRLLEFRNTRHSLEKVGGEGGTVYLCISVACVSWTLAPAGGGEH